MDALILDYILFTTTCLGALIAGLIDLRTTEIPDEVPLLIFLSALILHVGRAVFLDDFSFLLAGIQVGIAYLVLGYLLFHMGQWGEADALLLAAIGFAIPQPLSFFPQQVLEIQPYPLIFLLNLFITGAVYSILFAIGYALVKRARFSEFIAHLKARKRAFLFYPLLMLLMFSPMLVLYEEMAVRIFVLKQFVFASAGIILLISLLEFARWIDESVFTRYVKISELSPGDVLAEPIGLKRRKYSSRLFVGLEEKDILLIRKAYKDGVLKTEKKGYVKTKEGVRYALSFFLALLLTWKFGFLLFSLFWNFP